MKNTGVNVLKYTGIVLLVYSLLCLLFQIFHVMNLDILGLASPNALASLFFTAAGNIAIQMLFSFAGLAAGLVAVTLAEDDRFNSYLRWFGVGLIVIYLIEGLMLMSQADLFSWIRLFLLLVLSGLYLYGSWKLGKEDRAEEAKLRP